MEVQKSYGELNKQKVKNKMIIRVKVSEKINMSDSQVDVWGLKLMT